MAMRRHRTTEEARDALSRFCKRDRPVMHIPADPERDADFILGDVIEERDRMQAALERILAGKHHESCPALGCICFQLEARSVLPLSKE